MKNHILNVIDLYQQEDIDPYEKQLLDKEANWFITHDKSKNYSVSEDSILTLLEKEFYILCNVMEESGSINPYDYTVIQFYSKLDYLNSKVEKQQNQS